MIGLIIERIINALIVLAILLPIYLLMNYIFDWFWFRDLEKWQDE